MIGASSDLVGRGCSRGWLSRPARPLAHARATCQRACASAAAGARARTQLPARVSSDLLTALLRLPSPRLKPHLVVFTSCSRNARPHRFIFFSLRSVRGRRPRRLHCTPVVRARGHASGIARRTLPNAPSACSRRPIAIRRLAAPQQAGSSLSAPAAALLPATEYGDGAFRGCACVAP